MLEYSKAIRRVQSSKTILSVKILWGDCTRSRIFPVASSFGRCVESPDKVAGYWPANTVVRINADAIHKDYWKEPNKFNPDRWMVGNFEPKKIHSFIIFGWGLRLRPRRKLAMVKVCWIALLFTRKYEIDLVDMEGPLKTKSTVLTACTEMLVKIRPRN